MVKCNIIDVNTVNLVCDRSYFVKFYWIIYMLHLKVNKKVIMLIAGLFSCFTALFVFANSNTVSVGAAPTVVNGLDKEQLKKKLVTKLGLTVNDVIETELSGIALITTDQGLFYVSHDGEYLIQGKVFELRERPVDLADASLAKVRLEGINKYTNDMIVYPAENEKHVITVFTDITCGYCRKLHNQMDEYNAKGITIRYLPYPRSGIYERTGQLSQGFQDLRSIWCNEDPNKALTNAKAGGNVAQRICEKPLEEEFNFARRIGINATPALILENGMLIPGYQDPGKLADMLDNL